MQRIDDVYTRSVPGQWLRTASLAALTAVVWLSRRSGAVITYVPYPKEPVDYSSPIRPDLPSYERCKATHRCNRAEQAYNLSQASFQFQKQIYADGFREVADSFYDFEDWRAGSAPWGLDYAYLLGHANATKGAHFNPFDFESVGGRLYLNHSARITWDTDTATARIVHDGLPELGYTYPDNSSGNATAPPPSLALGLDAMLYNPEPASSVFIAGDIVSTRHGAQVALFSFESIFVGPGVLMNVTGSRPLVVLSRSSAIWDSPIEIEAATAGGFPGASNLSRADGLGVDEQGPGSASRRVYSYQLDLQATNVDEVQQAETFVDAGQTLRGSFVLSFRGRRSHPIRVGAEPGEVRRRLESAWAEAGSLRVTRGQRTQRGGHVYNVTFATAVGAQPLMEIESAGLSGRGAGAATRRLRAGSELGGAFQLAWKGTNTTLVPVTTTADELREELERSWGPVGLDHALVRRTNPRARRTMACVDGSCGVGGPGSAWGHTYTIHMTTASNNRQVVFPTDPRARDALPAEPVLLRTAGLTGEGANGTLSALELTHRALAAGVQRGLLVPSLPASVSYGGAGASHGGVGGLGHARHGPVGPVGFSEASFDLLGGSGGALGGATVEETVSRLSPDVFGDGLGGENTTGVGGAGGGAVELVAVNDLVIGPSGGIAVNAEDGTEGWRGGGGGAGGSIVLAAGGAVALHAPLMALGGAGGAGVGRGSRGGGGGSGGRVAIFAQSVSVLEDGQVFVEGGPGGPDGRGASGLDSLDGYDLAGDYAYPYGEGAPAPPARVEGVNIDGGRGSSAVYTAGGCQFGVDPFVGGAEGTQRSLRVDTRPLVRTEAGDAIVPAPFAQNGPAVQLPANGTGIQWIRRGANQTVPDDAPQALRDAVDAHELAVANGDPSAAAAAAAAAQEAFMEYGGSGFYGADWGADALGPSSASFGLNATGAALPYHSSFVPAGARPERVTVYARMGGYDLSGAASGAGPHVALHEHDFASAAYEEHVLRSVSRESMGQGGPPALSQSLLASEGSFPGGSGGAGPGGAAGPYGIGMPRDGGVGGGFGGDGVVMVGAGVVRGVWKHGSNYRHSPGAAMHPRAEEAEAGRGSPAEYDRWYKLDVFLNWENQTYSMRLDDVAVVRAYPFNGSSLRRIGLYVSGPGVAYFDEVYAGPDDTMGFACPESAPKPGLVQDLALAGSAAENTRADLLATLSPAVRAQATDDLAMRSRVQDTVPGLDVHTASASQELAMEQKLIDRSIADGDVTPGGTLHMDRPVQSGWTAEDVGPETTLHPMVRHDNHLSQRERYQHESQGGLVFFDGEGHRDFHSDIKTKTASGDHNVSHGYVHYGAMLHVPGDAPPDVLVDAASSSATRGLQVLPAERISFLFDQPEFDAPAAQDEDDGEGGAWAAHVAAALPGYENPRGGFRAAPWPQRLDPSAQGGRAYGSAGDFSTRGGFERDLVSGSADTDDLSARERARMRPSYGGSSGRTYWFGEHDSRPTQGTGRPTPAGATGIPQYGFIRRGGVFACSTNDFVSWRFEGMMYSFDNITGPANVEASYYANQGPDGDLPGDGVGPGAPALPPQPLYRSERPKVLYNNLTRRFVMWQHVDDTPNRTVRAAGIATSRWPGGPYTWNRTFLPDLNETTDLTVFQDADTGAAFLARTYYETTDYYLPAPVMQPVWESVKNPDGSTNFALNYHRANYERGYDDPDDIYRQRWRLEDLDWRVVAGDWVETYDNARNLFRLENQQTGVVREYAPNDRELLLDDTLDPNEARYIQGQGRPPVVSRYLNHSDPSNSAWSPSSVPAVLAQPWQQNYEDFNIADNPTHATVADLLIAPEVVVESRRAKFLAISQLDENYTDTTGVLRVIEGEMERQTDLIAVMGQYGRFGWESGQSIRTTFGYDVEGREQPFGFVEEVDWFDRHWQYTPSLGPGSRALDFRNFRDRQTSNECPRKHYVAKQEHARCQRVLRFNTTAEDSPAQTNFEFEQISYARATDTSEYEECLANHRQLLLEYQECLRAMEPDLDDISEWSVGYRECVGGGGQCGPPPLGAMPNSTYGFPAFVP